MRAIIIPINKIFLDFEKYDGSNFGERFRRRNRNLIKFTKTRLGGKVVLYCLAVPIFVSLLVFYILPISIFYFIGYGKVKAKKKINEVVDSIIDKMKVFKSQRRKNIFQLVNNYQEQGFELLVYYSPEIIPVNRRKQKIFFDKLSRMKEKLKIFHAFKVSANADVEQVISSFGINIQESFFMPDGKIIPSHFPQLNEFK